MTEVTQMQPAVLRAKDAAAYLGIGLTFFYELISSGKIRQGLVFSGRCRVWRRAWLDEFIDAVEEEQNKE